jgi:hypothetical protein
VDCRITEYKPFVYGCVSIVGNLGFAEGIYAKLILRAEGELTFTK